MVYTSNQYSANVFFLLCINFMIYSNHNNISFLLRLTHSTREAKLRKMIFWICTKGSWRFQVCCFTFLLFRDMWNVHMMCRLFLQLYFTKAWLYSIDPQHVSFKRNILKITILFSIKIIIYISIADPVPAMKKAEVIQKQLEKAKVGW